MPIRPRALSNFCRKWVYLDIRSSTETKLGLVLELLAAAS